jgi:ABC-type lipoprotein release transport system permease subunit
MSIWRLTLREISHRKIHFVLGLLSITVAIAAYIAATMLLRDSEQRDKVILLEMEKKQTGDMRDYREELKANLAKRRVDLNTQVNALQKNQAEEQQQQFVLLSNNLEQLEENQEIRLRQKEGKLAAEIGEHEQRLKASLGQSKTKLKTALSQRSGELEKGLGETQARLRARLQEREKAVAVAGAELQDAMRKITKGLGFNILILPRGQDINQFHLQGVASAVMPEAFVTKLANSKIVTINHLLPVITKRVKWAEQDNLEVVLIGTRGEVPLAHRDPKKPLLDIVPKGAMIVGHAVGKKLGLKKDQTVKLLGREFKVNKIHGERGSLDDSSIWLNLTEAQELLKMQNVINAILALECNCATADRVAEVRAELSGILPGTQIIERGTQALARAEARNKAKQKADEDLKQSAADARKILTEQLESAQATLAAQEASNEKTINEQEDRDRAFMDSEKKKMNSLLEQEKRDNQAALKQAGADNEKTLTQQKASHKQALESARENSAKIITNQDAKNHADQANAGQHAETILAAERTKRERLQAQKKRFAAILIPLAVAAAAIWIGLLTYGNARRRQSEIGILRAIGLRTSQILTLLLGKAFYLGLLGALLGVGGGLVLGLGLCETTLAEAQARQLIEPNNLLLAAALAPVIAMLGSWLPAIAAARQDPATILQEE